MREILELQEKHKKPPNEELFPLNIAIAKSKPASGYFDSNVGAVVYYSAKHESGTKVGQLNFLSDVIVNQIGLGADNANLRRRVLRPAVELAFSSPSIREQHQVPVGSIVISGNVDDQVFAHIGVEIQILALYRRHAAFVSDELRSRVAFAVTRSVLAPDVDRFNLALAVVNNKHPLIEAQFATAQ